LGTSDSVLVWNLFFSALKKTYFVVASVLNPVSVSIKISPFPEWGGGGIENCLKSFTHAEENNPKALKD